MGRTVPSQRTYLAESSADASAERSRQLATLTIKPKGQSTIEAERARREQEKVQQYKACTGGSSLGSRTLCFIATVLCHSFIPDTFNAQLLSPLCPMCTQRFRESSDRVGTLSRSSNDTVDSEDVDSISLGTLPEL